MANVCAKRNICQLHSFQAGFLAFQKTMHAKPTARKMKIRTGMHSLMGVSAGTVSLPVTLTSITHISTHAELTLINSKKLAMRTITRTGTLRLKIASAMKGLKHLLRKMRMDLIIHV
jgi:hypothetical protein